MRPIFLSVSIMLAACGSPSSTPPAKSEVPINPLLVARPYDTNIPGSYDPSKPAPLVILLHGFSANAFLQDAVFGLTSLSDARGFLYAMPNGTRNSKGQQFWNATDWCCNREAAEVDDVAYLNALIDDMQARYNVDPKRIFLAGHSNGGFMSYRMACEAAPRIAAIVSLAGAMWKDAARCQPSGPVAVLQVHGTSDDVVAYDGGPGLPSAKETVADWAAVNGCSPSLAATGATLDLDAALDGNETRVERHEGCAGGAAELWTLAASEHLPSFKLPAWPEAIYAFMLAHPKP